MTMRLPLVGCFGIVALCVGAFFLSMWTQSRVDAYTCKGVSSVNPNMPFEATPIKIFEPSILAKHPESREQLEDRASIRATYGDLSIALEELCRDSNFHF